MSGGFLDQGGMASTVLKARCARPPWGQACPQLGPLTGRDPSGSTRLGGVTIPLSVLRMSVCVSVHSRAWLPSSAFTYVEPKVLVNYWYHSYGAQFLCWRLTSRETTRPLPIKGGGGAKCAKGKQNAHFSRGQKLTHSPVHEEKHAEHHHTTLTDASLGR